MTNERTNGNLSNMVNSEACVGLKDVHSVGASASAIDNHRACMRIGHSVDLRAVNVVLPERIVELTDRCRPRHVSVLRQ